MRSTEAGGREAITLPMLAELGLAARLWQRTMRSENKADRTIKTYMESVVAFGRWLLEDETRPLDPAAMDKGLMLDFMAAQVERHKPATASVRFRALQQFFKFLVAEGDIKSSPMAGMSPPIIPEEPVPVIPDADLDKLLRVTVGTGFFDRRDHACIRFFLDTGVRVAEAAGMDVDDVDLDACVARVLGKGRKPRAVPFGDKTAAALERYLKARATYVREKTFHFKTADGAMARITATEGPFWVGIRGKFGADGIEQMFDRRCQEAKVAPVHPHQFRHTFSHHFLLNGGQEQDLMRLNGWRDRKMPGRYAASAGEERARKAHRNFSPGDRF